MVLVYVDDLLVLGTSEAMKAMILALRLKWETSEPERIGITNEVRFLGTELWRKEDSIWLMTQANYINKGLLKRNLGGEMSSLSTRRIPLAKEPEVADNPEEKTAANVKEAQTVEGELVWITARTRPDLAFVPHIDVWGFCF